MANKTIPTYFTRATYGDEGEYIAAGSVVTLKEDRACYFINRGKARVATEEDIASAAKAAKSSKPDKGSKSDKGSKPENAESAEGE